MPGMQDGEQGGVHDEAGERVHYSQRAKVYNCQRARM